jgi:heme/copper-type cytochrome/quinol oxidase subunit 2
MKALCALCEQMPSEVVCMKYVIAIVILLLVGCASNGTTGDVVGTSTGDASSAKTFTLTGEKFHFFQNGIESPELRVKQGDKVRVVLEVKDMMHDWVVDELNTRTPIGKTGETVAIDFIADKKGTFEYYCSVGKHRKNGMKGTIIVE